MIFLGACSTIKSTQQLGSEIYVLEKNKWEGTWVTGEGSIQLKVVDINSSEVAIMFIEKDEVQKYKAFIRTNGDGSYINVIDTDNHYFFAKFKKTRNQIVVWLPERHMMQKAISTGGVIGSVSEKKNVLITSEKKQLDSYFFENNNLMLFDYEEPIIFRKLIK